MFERFTQAARRAVVMAQEEAGQQGAPTLGVEHLLYGVLHDKAGAPAVVLARHGLDAHRVAEAVRAATGLDDEALATLGIDLDEVRRRAEDAFGPGALDDARPSRGRRRSMAGAIPFTPGAKSALAAALRTAAAHGDAEIGATQLFAGLIADASVARALARLGVEASPDDLIREVRAQRDQAA